MNRSISEAQQGDGNIRSTVRFEDQPEVSYGQAGFAALGRLLQLFAEQPGLLRHASDCPSEIRFWHDGTRWVVESVSHAPAPVLVG